MSNLWIASAPGVSNTRWSQPGSCGRSRPPSSTVAPGWLGLDRVVGGAQHARVLLGRAGEGPVAVRLVQDLPVVDRVSGVLRDGPAAASEFLGVRVLAEAWSRMRGARGGRTSFESAITWSRLSQSGSSPEEDAVRLDVDADVAPAERLRLAEDALLLRLRRAARVHHRVNRDGRVRVRRGGHSEGRARDGEEQINANYSHNGCSRGTRGRDDP